MGKLAKFPRLTKYYKQIIRTGSTAQDAQLRAERILAERTANSIDVLVDVVEVRANFYEAQIQYLPRDCEKYLTAIEKNWLKGIKSKILFADRNPDKLESLIKLTRDTGFYEICTVFNPLEVIPKIREETPELLVIKHELGEKIKATDVLSYVRQAGLRQKTIVHGELQQAEGISNYYKLSDVCYFLYLALDYELAHVVSLAINGILPKNAEQFFVHHIERQK